MKPFYVNWMAWVYLLGIGYVRKSDSYRSLSLSRFVYESVLGASNLYKLRVCFNTHFAGIHLQFRHINFKTGLIYFISRFQSKPTFKVISNKPQKDKWNEPAISVLQQRLHSISAWCELHCRLCVVQSRIVCKLIAPRVKDWRTYTANYVSRQVHTRNCKYRIHFSLTLPFKQYNEHIINIEKVSFSNKEE